MMSIAALKLSAWSTCNGDSIMRHRSNTGDCVRWNEPAPGYNARINRLQITCLKIAATAADILQFFYEFY